MLKKIFSKILNRINMYNERLNFLFNNPKLSLDITTRKIRMRFNQHHLEDALINKKSVYYNGIELPFYSQLGSDVKELKKIGILHDIFMQNYEREMLQFFKEYLNEGDVMVDIGANLGVTAAYAAMCVKTLGKIYCFEPVNYLYKTLVEIKRRNPSYNFIIENVALADTDGHSIIHVTKPPQIAGHTLSKEFAIKQKISEEQNVKLMKFDDYATTHDLFGKIKLIKMDVEGFELEVFKGMKKFLQQKPLPIIVFELIPAVIKDRQQTVTEFEQLLSDKYAFYKQHNKNKRIHLAEVRSRINVVGIPF